MPTLRVLLGMTIGALVALLGALFLGEYEFDEWLPILAGALLGLIVAEVVVSIGRERNLAIGLSTAAWSATAVVLAGSVDANETSPIKWGAYVSAGLAAAAALARANRWRREPAESEEPDVEVAPDVDVAPDPAVRPAASPTVPARRSPPPRRRDPQPLDVVEPPRITVSTRRRPRSDPRR